MGRRLRDGRGLSSDGHGPEDVDNLHVVLLSSGSPVQGTRVRGWTSTQVGLVTAASFRT
jgi:hypothetical protein